MNESIVISDDERKRLTTGRTVDRPKYTFFALNKAVEYSGANSKDVLGDVESIYEEFEEQYPDGDFNDWKKFYYQEYEGNDRLEEATERAYDKFVTMREAIQQIDRNDVREFLDGFALYGTYENRNLKEAVKAKLVKEFSGCRIPSGDAPEAADLQFGDVFFKIVSDQSKEAILDEDSSELCGIRAEEKSDGRIEIDISKLNQSLDEF